MQSIVDLRPRWRAPLLLSGFAALFLGISSGLARLGWSAPAPGLAGMHGPLMVCGFFGTVISLERAVALGRRWAYAAPLLAALATLASVLALPILVPMLATLGSIVLLASSLTIYRRQRAMFTLTLALAALCWSVGNLLWLSGWPIHAALPWWIAFLVLTIAGERLELSRLLPRARLARQAFAVLTGLLLAGGVFSLAAYAGGTLVVGAALVGLAFWLMRQDIARRTVRGRGLARYIAVCLLSGYAWLAVCGVAILASGGLGVAGPHYDLAVHALMLGFVFSMVFGHAPIIIPAVLRRELPYSAWFYVPLALLHGSLLLRVAGDVAFVATWRAWGGAGNAVALLAFVLASVFAMISAHLRDRPGGYARQARAKQSTMPVHRKEE
jgi:hypothetical protein